MAKKNTFSSLESLRGLSISSGAVFLGPWAGIDHEKFLIVAGVNPERILASGMLTTDEIHQFFGEDDGVKG